MLTSIDTLYVQAIDGHRVKNIRIRIVVFRIFNDCITNSDCRKGIICWLAQDWSDRKEYRIQRITRCYNCSKIYIKTGRCISICYLRRRASKIYLCTLYDMKNISKVSGLLPLEQTHNWQKGTVVQKFIKHSIHLHVYHHHKPTGRCSSEEARAFQLTEQTRRGGGASKPHILRWLPPISSFLIGSNTFHQ